MALKIYLTIVSGLLLQLTVALSDIKYTIPEEGGPAVYIGNVGKDAELDTEVDTIAQFHALRYSLLVRGNPNAEYFQVNETSGNLYSATVLDRDSICAFEKLDCLLEFEVIAQSSLGSFFKVYVRVTILDINDNAPVFGESIVSLAISEATKINSSISLNGASDPDLGANSVQSYKILSIDSPFEARSDIFPDGRSMLKLIVKGVLDRETRASYMLQVLALDGGNPSKSGSLMVNITLTDVNEYAPVFTAATYNVTIYEDHPVSRSILTVSALDSDEGSNAAIKYSLSALQNVEILTRFQINESTGALFLVTDLMSDSKDSYRIIVEACDNAKQPMLSQAQIFIKVIDNHNNAPKIDLDLLSDSGFAEVSEHASQGAAIALIAVTDRDSGANGLVTCEVLNKHFRIQKYDELEYKIVVFSSLNREVRSEYVVDVVCQDAGSPRKSAETTFKVRILDENDNAPRFLQNNYYAQIPENNVLGARVLNVSAIDTDLGPNAIVRYSIPTSNGHNFQIDPETGVISVHFSLDREIIENYSFQVLARDQGSPTLTGTAIVNIRVLDENDNAPTFGQDEFSFYIKENLQKNQIVDTIRVLDFDTGDNGLVQLYIKDLNPRRPVPFWLSENGSLYSSEILDRERVDSYHFIVVAKDNGRPAFVSQVPVVVHVWDENDNAPEFLFPTPQNNVIYVSYQATVNTIITTLRAIDNDTGVNSKLTYFSNDKNVSDIFMLNSQTGEVYLIKDLVFSDIGTYTFEVQVQDGGGVVSLHNSQKLVVKITETELDTKSYQYGVIAICITSVTVFIAIMLVFAIYLVRRYDQRKGDKFNKHLDESFSDKPTQEDFEAGFGTCPSPVETGSESSLPPSYSLVAASTFPRRPPVIDRSISLQVSTTQESRRLPPPMYPIWEHGSDVNDIERQRNKLINLQYQQSLLKLQTSNRSFSVMTI